MFKAENLEKKDKHITINAVVPRIITQVLFYSLLLGLKDNVIFLH